MSTPNYNFNLPIEGFDVDAWGGQLNDNWTSVDAALKSTDDNVAALQQTVNDLQNQINSQRIKVGDLYLSTSSTNPATRLGYGSWERFGEGRALVSVGSADGMSWTNGQTRGEADVKLSESQIPSHDHSSGSLATDSRTLSGSFDITRGVDRGDGDRRHGLVAVGAGAFDVNPKAGASIAIPTVMSNQVSYENRDEVRISYTHNHSISGNTGNAGGGGSHNNIQPSIAVYVWKRTA